MVLKKLKSSVRDLTILEVLCIFAGKRDKNGKWNRPFDQSLAK